MFHAAGVTDVRSEGIYEGRKGKGDSGEHFDELILSILCTYDSFEQFLSQHSQPPKEFLTDFPYKFSEAKVTGRARFASKNAK